MKGKVIKFVAFLLIVVLVVACAAPIANAGLVSNAQGESGPRPDPPTPNNSPQTKPSNPSTPSTESGPKKTTITHMRTISGKVYEAVGQKIGEGKPDGTASNSTIDGRPVEGVIVNLRSGGEDGEIKYHTITGPDGSYSFSPEAGTYTVEFRYGDINSDKIDKNNINLMRNVLKYNGHDYITILTPKEQKYEYESTQQIEIINSGKGCAQVFLAVDCSAVMRSTMVEVNGKTQSRLEVAVDAARRLIDELIDSGENIYIGLVFFSGTNYRAVSLTKNKADLNKALDEIVSNNWQTHNTDIEAALQTVMESYYNNDELNSNRYLAILTDGVPTKAGDVETFSDMSASEIMSTLEQIKQMTKEKISEVTDSGVKLFSLIVEGEEDEVAWAEDIFGEPASDIYTSAKDGTELIQAIYNDLQEYILSTTEVKEWTSEYKVLAGYEDADRRKEVDDNFKDKFTYDNTIMFKQIDSYNATEEDKALASDLSEKTWMRVVGGTYTIDEPVPNPSRIEKKNDEGEVIEIIEHVASGYYNQNVILAQRPAISLVTQTTTTGLEVTLADHSVLTQQTAEVGSDLPLIFYMDDEIAHGATVKLEYTIRVKNDSSIQCNYLELINYPPAGFIFAQDTTHITEAKTNRDYGWEQVSLQELLNNNLISQGTYDKYSTRDALKLTLDNNGQGANGFYIPPGGEYDIKITVTKVISSLNNLEVPLENVSEVLAYKDSANRRMAYLNNENGLTADGSSETTTVSATNIQSTNNSQLVGVYPGDSADRDFSTTQNRAFIIPPTGIAQIILTVVGAGAIVIAVFMIPVAIGKSRAKRKKAKK